MKIAVTGGAASGKSFVCRRLSEKGVTVISLDDVSRDLMRPGTAVFRRVVHVFGQAVLRADGTLDRPALRQQITGSPESRRRLESIVQPAILNEMNRLIRESEAREEPYVVVEVPLLFELGMEQQFDVSILVAVDQDTQVMRLVQRDGVSETDARRLMDLQMPLGEKMARADIVIDNSSSSDILYGEVDRLLANAFKK
ncbi:MAG: dephospho-CoA kinase [Desulfobacteraceae bacterium]